MSPEIRGSGKSWCLEVMLAYADLFRFKIKYGGDDARIWWRIARADEIVARFVETTSIDEYKKAKLLCIQDFGAEQLEAVAMGNRMNVLRTLLEYRGDRSDCLTMITSNYSLKNPTLTESYGERNKPIDGNAIIWNQGQGIDWGKTLIKNKMMSWLLTT